MQIGASLFNIQSVYEVQQNGSVKAQSQSAGASLGDTVNISSEARLFYEQSLAQKEQDAKAAAKVVELEQAAMITQASGTEEQDMYAAAAQEFKDTLYRHKGNNSGSSESASGSSDGANGLGNAGGAGASSGGGSTSSGTAEAMEDLEDRIKQVSAELASASSAAIKTGDVSANARVEQLQSELEQLQSQLAALQAQSEDSSA